MMIMFKEDMRDLINRAKHELKVMTEIKNYKLLQERSDELSILEATKEFAIANDIPYNKQIESLITNAIREVEHANISAILSWANLLEDKRFGAFTYDDLEEFFELKHKLYKEFVHYCETATCVDNSDEMEYELMWLATAIKFFVERGYMCKNARP